jgi:uncharacterized protein (DUF1786 family)
MDGTLTFTDRMKQVIAVCVVAGGAFTTTEVRLQLNTAHRLQAEKREIIVIKQDDKRRDSMTSMQIEMAEFRAKFGLMEKASYGCC